MKKDHVGHDRGSVTVDGIRKEWQQNSGSIQGSRGQHTTSASQQSIAWNINKTTDGHSRGEGAEGIQTWPFLSPLSEIPANTCWSVRHYKSHPGFLLVFSQMGERCLKLKLWNIWRLNCKKGACKLLSISFDHFRWIYEILAWRKVCSDTYTEL